ncbi:MAG: hypothetical protein M5U14_08570 [Acidimicrobiia bacterium]|nr:hypothetical protein [Acidimicrobiia bacterium]
MRRLVLAVLVLVLALAAAACDKRSEKADAGAAGTSTTGDPIDPSDGVDDSVGDGALEPSTTVPSFTGEGAEEFCATERAFADQFAAALGGGQPTVSAELYDQVLGLLDDLAVVAPAEIAGDVQVLRDVLGEFRAPLAAAGWDAAQVPVEDQAMLMDQAFVTAVQRIGQYEQQVCLAGLSG